MELNRMKMQTRDGVADNISWIAEKFPNCVTEKIDTSTGEVRLAVDFDVLRQELSSEIVEGKDERYQFVWPDKKKAIILANAPINATLRPCEKESVNFDTTQNLYIEGDNLDVLKCLKETYLGKVDVIYVDPPYNTGRNLIYKNDFSTNVDDYMHNSGQFDTEGNRLIANLESNGRFHTDWLNMIYPRIKVAKDLLKDTGIFVLTIDDCEIQTVTMLLNEIFGSCNHLGTIVVKNNPSGRSTTNGVSIAHEYALFYRKQNDVSLGRLPRSEKQISRYKEKDSKGPFEWVNFRARYSTNSPKMAYPILIKKDGTGFRIPKLKWDDGNKKYIIDEPVLDSEFISMPFDAEGNLRSWKWSIQSVLENMETEMAVRKDSNGDFAVYAKSRMNQEGMLPLTVWDDTKYSSTEYGTNYLTNLMGKRYFDYPKSIYSVIDSLRVANASSDSLILDFFSGSATTAHAVMLLNAEDRGKRKFIMVQLPEKTDEKSVAYKEGYNTICEIGKERIRRAGQKIKEEFPLMSQDLDTGFRVLKLDSSNLEDVYYAPAELKQEQLDLFADNVKPGRNSEDLLFQSMLDLGATLDSKIEKLNVNGKIIYNVADGYLVACFDTEVSDEVVKAIAKMQPQYAVLRDSSLKDDSTATNFEQIFKTYSPTTTCKIL